MSDLEFGKGSSEQHTEHDGENATAAAAQNAVDNGSNDGTAAVQGPADSEPIDGTAVVQRAVNNESNEFLLSYCKLILNGEGFASTDLHQYYAQLNHTTSIAS